MLLRKNKKNSSFGKRYVILNTPEILLTSNIKSYSSKNSFFKNE